MKGATDSGVELGMERIQFGAPSSGGSTDSDGVPAMLEKTSDNKLPEPKEQRQKQPRAGPIKPQKVSFAVTGSRPYSALKLAIIVFPLYSMTTKLLCIIYNKNKIFCLQISCFGMYTTLN